MFAPHPTDGIGAGAMKVLALWLKFSKIGKCGHLHIHRPSVNIQSAFKF